MIITHMPAKMAVLTALIIALVLAACTVLYVAVSGRSEWRVYRGSGREVKASEGTSAYFSARTTEPGHGRWFEFRALATPTESGKSADERYAVNFMARTTTGFSGRVELVTAGGTVYEQKLNVPVTEEWERAVLHLAGFRRQGAGPDAPGNASGTQPKAAELTGRVVFVVDGPTGREGSETLALEVSRPILEKIVSRE